jgi:3-deoxy-D-manno-octulosonate 8-phosphate phosphatase (KDO 8-P phosphatase)
VQIKAIALDVDGVLTDGGFWWGPEGEEWKRFSFIDIMGLSLARKAGVKVALISGENSPLLDRLASKVGVTDVYRDCKDKARALRSLAEHYQMHLQEICFMGDDINDLPALEIAGLAAAPANARPAVLERCQFITKATGGNGAVRELVDYVLERAKTEAAAESIAT